MRGTAETNPGNDVTESDGEQCTLSLIARVEIEIDGKVVPVGSRTDVTPATATEHMLAGRAKLRPEQNHPPRVVVGALFEKCSDLTVIGPIFLREKAIQSFEDSVLANGSRRNVVEGHALRWMQGAGQLRRAMFDLLNIDDAWLADIVGQLEACWESRRERAETTALPSCPSAARCAELGLALAAEQPAQPYWITHGRSFDREPRRYLYSDVGRDWVAFQRELNDLKFLGRHVIQRALAEGRVLAVTEESGRAALRAPWSWNETTKLPKSRSVWYFLFSKDLPAQWLPKASQVRGTERARMISEIRSYIENRYLTSAPNHHLFRKKRIIDDVVDAFEVSPSLAKDAWQVANIPHWKKRGARTKT